MKNEDLIKILSDIGLSENESKVYFAALSLGPATVLKIARAAEVKRTTVYSVVESLKQKGLMNIEVKGFKQLYVAESPEKLETVLEQRRAEFKNSLSEFMALYNLKGGESYIKYYEGLEAMKNVYEELLKDIQPHEDYLVVSAIEQWYKLDPDYFWDFVERRSKLPIKVRMLFTDSKESRKRMKRYNFPNTQIKLLSPKTKLTTNLVVIPKKVVIHQLTPPIMAIVIENKSVVQMHKELFEIIWKVA